jgi:hypothetical protein
MGGMEYALTNVACSRPMAHCPTLMLDEIRSRFGGNALGFAAMGVFWPRRTASYGAGAALWFITRALLRPFVGI